MQSIQKEKLVARIKCGYLRINGELKVVPFTDDLLYEAEELYEEIYSDALMEGVLDNDEMLIFLRKKGLFTKEMFDEMYDLENQVDDIKVKIYESALRSETKEKLVSELDKKRKRLEFLKSRRNSWESATAEGFASYAKWQFLLEKSTYTMDGRLYDWSNYTLQEVLSYYQANIISEKDMREIVRTEPWTTQWAIMKKISHYFTYPLSIDQQNCILWSSLYDSISESMEAPSKFIINDDNCLDGWLILKRKEEHKEPLNEKKKKYEEVFMLAETPEDAKRIHEMNGTYGRTVVNSRLTQIETKGQTKFHEFSDMQNKKRMIEQGLNKK